MAKKTYELKANINTAQIWLGDRQLEITSDKPYETSDPQEQQLLEEFDAVKVADKGGKS